MTHNDGTPMSTDNDFYWNTGQPSIFCQDPYFNKALVNSQSATQTIQKARQEGQDKSTFYGLSRKADNMVYQFKLMFSTPIISREEQDKTRSIRNSR